jgi:hypothetical protein
VFVGGAAAGFSAIGDFSNSTLVGTLTMTNANTSFISRTGDVGTVTLGGGADNYGGTVIGAHLTTTPTANNPGIAPIVGQTTGASIAGNDNTGRIFCNMAVAPVAGAICTVSFATPYPLSIEPEVVLGRYDVNAAGEFSVINLTNTGFQVSARTAPTGGVTYEFGYVALGRP